MKTNLWFCSFLLGEIVMAQIADNLEEIVIDGATVPVSEIHFTPGTPYFLKASFTYWF